jgi:hypothetical protein
MTGIAALQKVLADQDYRYRYHNAKATGTCILCGENAMLFTSASSQMEYRVSAICQDCQDKHFKTSAVFP